MPNKKCENPLSSDEILALYDRTIEIMKATKLDSSSDARPEAIADRFNKIFDRLAGVYCWWKKE